MKRIALMMALIALAPLALAQENFITMEQNNYWLFQRDEITIEVFDMLGTAFIGKDPLGNCIYALPDNPGTSYIEFLITVDAENAEEIWIYPSHGTLVGSRNKTLHNGTRLVKLILPNETTAISLDIFCFDGVAPISKTFTFFMDGR